MKITATETIILKNQSAFYARGRLKTAQSGMTLLEVVVAMFVLAIGVLALLATQLKTVAGVREAESQTIVAQAVQNLIEGMLVNPTLSAAADNSGEATGWALKSYDAYLTGGTQIQSSGGAVRYDGAGQISKLALSRMQISQFQQELFSALGGQVFYAICLDSSGRAPTVSNGNMAANCTAAADAPTVVKVAWLMDNEENRDGTPGLNTDGDYFVYTYQARVTQ
ncbi:type IV pilus modification protein PilV [Uruburuella testudinis]|uniref:Type IV pilus modification protein PilV n=1 Tax=Uruburuella testudinis TaxID=1282863 RepID=A0ABY4DW58_9NEIS|nr:type IV pilus modification protein PilV [Uruburuella testudinis]UOO82949.1 type IV pilus modification protein PilV [Uruburuella testudinis]